MGRRRRSPPPSSAPGLADPDLTIVDVRPIAGVQRLAPQRRGARRPHPRRGRVPERLADAASTPPRSSACSTTRASCPAATIVVYGDGPTDVAALRGPPRGVGHRRRPRLRRRASRPGPPTPALPVERLPNYDKLVHTDWLARAPRRRTPEAAPAGKFLLFHVNFGVPEEYAEDHIPGALYLDTNWLEDPADWNRRSPEELETALRALGITHDTTVVLYGRDTEGEANEKWPGRRAGPDRRDPGRR